MVQVDVFWAYGLGGSLAMAAGNEVAKEAKPLHTPQFTKSLLFLSLVWAPTGLLLLIKHPSWETMQVAESFAAMPAWLTIGFGITNITQGILGFWITSLLLKRQRYYAAHLNWLFGYLGMFFILVYGWDGLGYDRFFYDRDMFGGMAWTPGAGVQDYAWFGFFASSVAITLYIDGVYLLPPLLYLVAAWTVRNTRRDCPESEVSALGVMLRYLGAVFFVALPSCIFAAVVVHYTGKLLGAGEHAQRWAGTGGNTPMHILSYFVGLPLAVGLLWAFGYRKGGLVERYLMRLTPHLASGETG